MTVINRLYASSGPEVIIGTLEVVIGENRHFLCQGFEDVNAYTETGEQVTFTACGIELSLPARNADGTQDLQFVISNINGVVSNEIRVALDSGDAGKIIFRQYIDTDLSAPAEPPISMPVKGGSWGALSVSITAGFKNILDYSWPRHRFTAPEYPGLRHM